MQSEFELNSDADEPLQRGRTDEETEELDPEQELMRATQFEFREVSVTLPGDLLA